MRLQHYFGGLENLGPVNFFDKKVFMAEWEKRIFGIHTVMMAESAHLANALQKYPIAQHTDHVQGHLDVGLATHRRRRHAAVRILQISLL